MPFISLYNIICYPLTKHTTKNMTVTNKIEIAQILREKTSMTIKDFANKNYVSRKTLYEALEGNSSRRVRVLIAKAVQIPPSMLWTENTKEKRIVDDIIYYTGAI